MSSRDSQLGTRPAAARRAGRGAGCPRCGAPGSCPVITQAHEPWHLHQEGLVKPLAALEAVLATCQWPLQPAGLQGSGWRALPREGRLCPRDRPVCRVREAPTRDGLSEDIGWGGRPALQRARGPSVRGAPGEATAPRSLCCTADRLSDLAPLLRSGTPQGVGDR